AGTEPDQDADRARGISLRECRCGIRRKSGGEQKRCDTSCHCSSRTQPVDPAMLVRLRAFWPRRRERVKPFAGIGSTAMPQAALLFGKAKAWMLACQTRC